ncbi:MAG TPA: hypothetical protein PKW07_11965 [Syntrophorhabdaceae bacterium]|nr:hypothetical protein [Syntrophorhabdaceae bacterium]
MQLNWIEIVSVLALTILVTVAVTTFVYKKRKPKQNQLPEPVLQQQIEQTQEAHPIHNVPKEIVIGESPAQPVVTIKELNSVSEYKKAKPLDIHSHSISRMSGLFQAVPSLLVANATHGKQLMEVVINGSLVRAADGNGFRAFAMGAGHIKENARLFELPNLQSLINAAAIWQVASVIVAQKHLADISKKLDEIKDGIKGISLFLDNQRKARIQSTYDYLRQAYQSLHAGELPDSVRNELENCERDLLEIQHHLESEYKQKIDEKVEVQEIFGTGELTSKIKSKIEKLHPLIGDMELCLKTRIAGWYVVSLYPGEAQLKLARLESIYKSIESYESLGAYSQDILKQEISSIDSIFNSEETLMERRRMLNIKCTDTVRHIEQKAQMSKEAVNRIGKLLLEKDRPTRMLLEYDKGVLVGAREG